MIIMKKIITIALIIFSFSAAAQQKQDTVKKYNLVLSEDDFTGLKQKLFEAAQYEAEVQKQNTLKAFDEFFKDNLQIIPPKDTLGKK